MNLLMIENQSTKVNAKEYGYNSNESVSNPIPQRLTTCFVHRQQVFIDDPRRVLTIDESDRSKIGYNILGWMDAHVTVFSADPFNSGKMG